MEWFLVFLLMTRWMADCTTSKAPRSINYLGCYATVHQFATNMNETVDGKWEKDYALLGGIFFFEPTSSVPQQLNNPFLFFMLI